MIHLIKWMLSSVLFLLITNGIVNNALAQEQPQTTLQEITEKSKNSNYFKSNIRTPDISDVECLAFALYGEARGEGRLGMTAVAFVIHNRFRRWHMQNYCDVIRQPYQFQFSVAPPSSNYEEQSWYKAVNLSNYLINQEGFSKIASPVNEALYFNSLDDQIDWKNYKLMIVIGKHYFYQ